MVSCVVIMLWISCWYGVLVVLCNPLSCRMFLTHFGLLVSEREFLIRGCVVCLVRDCLLVRCISVNLVRGLVYWLHSAWSLLFG